MSLDRISEEDFSNPEFKEDSVRELVIAPLLEKLGYSHKGDVRVARSKPLSHPFIRIGTRNHPVTTIPDYTLYYKDKPILVLDAKAPSAEVHSNSHVQQAYSYAIHPEVQCREFSLCNGRAIAFYDIYQREALAVIDYSEFEDKWELLRKHLSPEYITEPARRRFAPDFGLALHRLGVRSQVELCMLGVRLNLYARIDEKMFTASANTEHAGEPHMVSFDFEHPMLDVVVSSLPDELAKKFTSAMSRAPFKASAGLAIELDLRCHLGELVKVEGDHFSPLIVDEVLASRFIPDPGIAEPINVPDEVFKLRQAYKIVSDA
ncbi:type I restriction enzyme HsdR N-terminal domain-containing protein [Stenotrophomonas maltophilia]|uniref:type I restriction enzyme HsdR N-terminal domain-containing protein n=1 Tax=Stenotrophomonas maltophilia TaxID=40324 RepID=UPI000C14C311|nr:type I restriction enzyme HsdR N-terminal domain-containing protein [Stenotrophomonas maltophilia]